MFTLTLFSPAKTPLTDDEAAPGGGQRAALIPSEGDGIEDRSANRLITATDFFWTGGMTEKYTVSPSVDFRRSKKKYVDFEPGNTPELEINLHR